ncbi:MAG: hypothetical protein JXA97_08490 [Anaerolineales bacterium]|nr:hypothetical protein [Anaerolineales bacterium]
MAKTKIGFRYYPDTRHYTQQDLDIWLPELRTLGTELLVLEGSVRFAVPEVFITGLIHAGIRPVIHMPSGFSLLEVTELETLLSAYANWGVAEVIVGDSPNQRTSWEATDWSRSNLVERFVDRLLPVLEAEFRHGLTPLLPPLQPGGDYWDTAFLRDTLVALQRRAHPGILQALGLAIKVWTFGKPIDWGMGGASAWPQTRAYAPSETSQDQLGFRIMDWYNEISLEVLGHICPFFAVSGGSRFTHLSGDDVISLHTDQNAAIFSQLRNEPIMGLSMFAFDHLVSMPSNARYADAWFASAGAERPVVEAVRSMAAAIRKQPSLKSSSAAIDHVVYLPDEEYAVCADLLREAAPFLAAARPVITFDLGNLGAFRRATVLANDPISSVRQQELGRHGETFAFFDRKTIPALNAAAGASQAEA